MLIQQQKTEQPVTSHSTFRLREKLKERGVRQTLNKKKPQN
jgi:hypothetical protein